MLFNSIDFAIFLPIVFGLYWLFSKNLKAQNAILLIASYFFYGWWDWRFLSLIVFSSIIDYFVGLGMLTSSSTKKRKLLLLTSIFVNLGFLGFFKYYNFFLDNFVSAFSFFGQEITSQGLNIILPVGISFYTFQTLSYSIDVYKRKLEPTKDIISFLSFVSFFPQLVAGPIERATNLLPQFHKKRTFDYSNATDGMRQILWGLFKKVVVADNVAPIVNEVFSNYQEYNGITLMLIAVLFAFQIYGDFSGYSDIAIGTARLFGFSLMQNFAFPYFSRDIAEFWRRWHISLSTWFRDYVYIPLGGSVGSNFLKIRNIFIIFIVSGFWHGANWTFIIWGAINALLFLPIMLLNKNRVNTSVVAKGKILPNVKEILMIGFTFLMTVIAWIFFRADNVNIAFSILAKIFSYSLFTLPQIIPAKQIIFILILVILEWINREKLHGLELVSQIKQLPIRWLFYFVLIIIIIKYGGSKEEFIYFQF